MASDEAAGAGRSLDFLTEALRRDPVREALVWRDASFTYGWLDEAVGRWTAHLRAAGVGPGAVVALEADFSPNAIACLLALVARGCVCVPLTPELGTQRERLCGIAEVGARIRVGDGDAVHVTMTGREPAHELLLRLRDRGHPGLVLFSSGSTGESKGAVHDLVPLLARYRAPRRTRRMLSFLLFDHIGGVNTLFYTLSNAGCLVTPAQRTPDAVCAAIARHRVEVLPTSPTFLNLLLIGEAHRRHDLSSLQLVTYGTEPMPASTLARARAAFPSARLLQTYGLTELGVLRSHSRASDSLWVRLGGEGYAVRVVEGLLEIRADTAMLGYLNAPCPFTEDGWFRTGDAVEVDGEWLRILGRRSEMINVGGRKVYPAEVESVLQEMDGVEDVAVAGEPSPITGQMVLARIRLSRDEAPSVFRRRMRAFCRQRLQRYQIPQKILLLGSEEGPLHGGRFKKTRRGS